MMHNLRIAFFGTPDFAVASLKKIVESKWNVVAVITAPDKPSGRGQSLQPSEVKKYALHEGLHILQPDKLKSAEFVDTYRSLNIDLAVVVAFRMMPEVIWSAPRLGTINLHGSLLPNYRGAAPINWAIINGEKETGLTTFFLNHDIDTGDILYQKKCAILDDDNFGTLYARMKELGADLLVETMQRIEANDYSSYRQIPKATDRLAPKIEKDMLELKDYASAEAIHHFVRGLSPIYKPYFYHKDKKYIIKKGYSSLESTAESAGTLCTDHISYLKMACTDGYYYITEIQAEGKKTMDIKSFLNGNSL